MRSYPSVYIVATTTNANGKYVYVARLPSGYGRAGITGIASAAESRRLRLYTYSYMYVISIAIFEQRRKTLLYM